MFAHLDDPTPPAAADQRGPVADRLARRRRQRVLVRAGIALVVAVVAVTGGVVALGNGSGRTTVRVGTGPTSTPIMVGGGGHAHRVTVSPVTVTLPAGWYAARVPLVPSLGGTYGLFVASSAPLVTKCQPLTIYSGRSTHQIKRVERCHFRVPTARPGAVSMSWQVDEAPDAGSPWPSKRTIGGRLATITISHQHGTCDGMPHMVGAVFGKFRVNSQEVITSGACLSPFHESAQIAALLSILMSTHIHT
jgi:hypothetical protein